MITNANNNNNNNTEGTTMKKALHDNNKKIIADAAREAHKKVEAARMALDQFAALSNLSGYGDNVTAEAQALSIAIDKFAINYAQNSGNSKTYNFDSASAVRFDV